MVNSDMTHGTGTSASVGVVTVTYSPGEALHRFLVSLATATTQPVHIVLADNGSTDGAPQQATAQRPEVTLVATGSNLGYGGGANRGVAALPAGIDWVVVANPDIEWQPGSLDALLVAAARWPRGGALGPLIREPTGAVYPSARLLPSLGPEGSRMAYWAGCGRATRGAGPTTSPTPRWRSGRPGGCPGRVCCCGVRRSTRSAGLTSGTSCTSRTSTSVSG